jgi:two-component system sensor histidine kinase/response regulator
LIEGNGGQPLNQETTMSSDVNSTAIADSTSDDPLAGDPELRKELAGMFLEDCPKLLLEIHTAATAHDGPALKLAAHTLKGSAGVFKIAPAFDAALRMEHVGKESDWSHAEEAWEVLNREMANLSSILRKL